MLLFYTQTGFSSLKPSVTEINAQVLWLPGRGIFQSLHIPHAAYQVPGQDIGLFGLDQQWGAFPKVKVHCSHAQIGYFDTQARNNSFLPS